MKSALVTLIGINVGLTVSVAQQTPNHSAFERVSAVVAGKMKEYGVPGAPLGVVRHGSRAVRTFGVTRVENSMPVTETTIFQIGSIIQ